MIVTIIPPVRSQSHSISGGAHLFQTQVFMNDLCAINSTTIGGTQTNKCISAEATNILYTTTSILRGNISTENNLNDTSLPNLYFESELSIRRKEPSQFIAVVCRKSGKKKKGTQREQALYNLKYLIAYISSLRSSSIPPS